MNFQKKAALVVVAVVAAVLVIVSVACVFVASPSPQGDSYSGPPASRSPAEKLAGQSLELTPAELEQFKVKPAMLHVFNIEREAVGNIDFNQELSTDVFPPVQGKILKLFASAGDDVRAGAPLYTIDSPDLVQAGSTLIAAAGTLELTTRALKRAKELFEVQGFAQKDLDQAISDQQGAEAALKAARDAVRIF